jgi:hypothetical protein
MNVRGAGYLFGSRQAKDFCRMNGELEFVAKSHQLVDEGAQRSGNKASIMKYEKEKGGESEL